MDFLFHFQLLIGVIAQNHSAETELVESTAVQQLWACVTTKKLILDNFLNSSKLSILAAKIVWIMSPYTSNASDSHTVLHHLCEHFWVNMFLTHHAEGLVDPKVGYKKTRNWL
jgi:hypothetical protein